MEQNILIDKKKKEIQDSNIEDFFSISSLEKERKQLINHL
jgi:hypothetical protein